MKTSEFLHLDWVDLSKGLIVAMGGATISAVQSSLEAGSFTFNCKTIAGVALASGLSYLAKNFFTPAKNITPAH
jgi:hypothetical protein